MEPKNVQVKKNVRLTIIEKIWKFLPYKISEQRTVPDSLEFLYWILKLLLELMRLWAKFRDVHEPSSDSLSSKQVEVDPQQTFRSREYSRV